jgi:hypothetical protein
MKINAHRVVCGLATVFDQPSLKDGDSWSAEIFRDWVDVAQPIPLLYDHTPIFSPWGVTPKLGTAYRFAEVSYPVHGILALCEIEAADGWGDSALADIKSILSQRYLPAAWGLSIAVYPAEDMSFVVPFELSLTKRPSFEDCKILGVGCDAIDLWHDLTEQRISVDRG